jgi:hypothetical protein
MATLRDVPLRQIPAGGPNFAAFNPDPRLATLNVGFRHIGYPDATQLADGRIAAVYHLYDDDGRQVVDCTTFRLVD